MISAGIVGGSGYTGGELIRLLINHPEVNLKFIYSSSRPGTSVAKTHTDLTGIIDLKFSDKIEPDTDVVFLCLGHGHSREFLSRNEIPKETRIIDLSTDFRLEANSTLSDRTFIYGLPELNLKEITASKNIANPGCFATAIQLALLPLAEAKLLKNTVHINAITGSTGAGVKPTPTTHFSWRNNNISWYKPFSHQHLDEIKESLTSLEPQLGELFFLPHRGNFSRGILSTAYTEFSGDEAEALDIYRKFYAEAPFTQIVDQPIQLKQVVNTNQCHIHLHKYKDILLITSAIDNLLKGASGQAVQNMNLMFGFDEQEALRLKAGIF